MGTEKRLIPYFQTPSADFEKALMIKGPVILTAIKT